MRDQGYAGFERQDLPVTGPAAGTAAQPGVGGVGREERAVGVGGGISERPPLEGNLIPAFDLPRAGGGRLRLRSLRGRRAVALYFLHDVDCPGCREIAAAIIPRYGDYAFADAEPVLIVPCSEARAESLRGDLAIPYPVLFDADGAVGRRYGAGGAALLIADRFGAPVLWQRAGRTHDLPDQDAVLAELEYLAHTCSGGRATPIWPESDAG